MRHMRWVVWAVLMIGAGSAFAAAKEDAPKRDPKLHERLERALANEDRIREALVAMQEELRVIKIRANRSTAN